MTTALKRGRSTPGATGWQRPAGDGAGEYPLPTPPVSVGVIESIATGVPAASFDQLEAAERVAALFDDTEQRERIVRVYQNTMVKTRHFAIDPLGAEFLAFSQSVGTIRERMALYFQHAVPLAVDVARRAMEGCRSAADEFGLLVFVTSTGFIAPGVDAALINQLGFPLTISRMTINFMGCAAAMNGLHAAVDFARAHPDKKALVVCLELSSINAVFADNANDLIIHSLFGDGCGAMVVGAASPGTPAPPGAIIVRDGFSQLFPGTEDGIVLGVNHNGITCELAESLPKYIYRGVDAALAQVLADNKLTKSTVDLWAIHPGGPKIVDEASRSLNLPPDASRWSWDVLAEFGNMLSVSLIFVLQRIARQTGATKDIETGVAFSFAPGVALEGIVFDVVRR